MSLISPMLAPAAMGASVFAPEGNIGVAIAPGPTFTADSFSGADRIGRRRRPRSRRRARILARQRVARSWGRRDRRPTFSDRTGVDGWKEYFRVAALPAPSLARDPENPSPLRHVRQHRRRGQRDRRARPRARRGATSPPRMRPRGEARSASRVTSERAGSGVACK